jgi:hypothetical protein
MTTIYVAPPTKGEDALSFAVARLMANVKKLPAGHRRLVAETDFADSERAIHALEKELTGTLNDAAKEVEPRKVRTK